VALIHISRLSALYFVKAVSDKSTGLDTLKHMAKAYYLLKRLPFKVNHFATDNRQLLPRRAKTAFLTPYLHSIGLKRYIYCLSALQTSPGGPAAVVVACQLWLKALDSLELGANLIGYHVVPGARG
jgi:hypothetical protein